MSLKRKKLPQIIKSSYWNYWVLLYFPSHAEHSLYSGHLDHPAHVGRVHFVVNEPLGETVPFFWTGAVDGKPWFCMLVLTLLQIVGHFLNGRMITGKLLWSVSTLESSQAAIGLGLGLPLWCGQNSLRWWGCQFSERFLVARWPQRGCTLNWTYQSGGRCVSPVRFSNHRPITPKANQQPLSIPQPFPYRVHVQRVHSQIVGVHIKAVEDLLERHLLPGLCQHNPVSVMVVGLLNEGQEVFLGHAGSCVNVRVHLTVEQGCKSKLRYFFFSGWVTERDFEPCGHCRNLCGVRSSVPSALPSHSASHGGGTLNSGNLSACGSRSSWHSEQRHPSRRFSSCLTSCSTSIAMAPFLFWQLTQARRRSWPEHDWGLQQRSPSLGKGGRGVGFSSGPQHCHTHTRSHLSFLGDSSDSQGWYPCCRDPRPLLDTGRRLWSDTSNISWNNDWKRCE